MTDADLLAQHHAGAPDAFAAIVRRHVDWVHGVARRRVGGDAHLAEDVTQATFLALAQRSRSLRPDASLPAWLFRVTSNVAARAVRDRRRRERLERIADMTRASEPTSDEWQTLAPVVDALVGQLRQGDREAILLRFYRQMPHAEVGASLGITEEAARKRVDRAVGRLREVATRHGIVAPAAAFGALLLVGLTPSPAPAGVVAIAVTAASRATTASANGLVLTKGAIVMTKNMKLAMLCAASIAFLVTRGIIVSTLPSRTTSQSSIATTTRHAEPSAVATTAIPRSKASSNALRELIRSASNLRMLGQGLLLYANEHDSRDPPSLGATLPNLIDRNATSADRAAVASVFFAPGELDPANLPATVTPAWLDAHTSVAFLAHDCDEEALANGDRLVVLCTNLDDPFEHEGRAVVNVGYANGAVEMLDVDIARQRINASRSTIDEARTIAALPLADHAIAIMQFNLRRIGAALALAADQMSERRFPPSLGVALEWLDGTPGLGVDDNAFAFLTLTDRQDALAAAGPWKNTSAWVDAHASFVYLAANVERSRLASDVAAKTIVAHTKLDAANQTSNGDRSSSLSSPMATPKRSPPTLRQR